MQPTSRGPAISAEDLAQRAAARSLLDSNLSLLVANAEKILATPEMYFCAPPSCFCGWPYIAYGGPLYLGYLLEGYMSGALLEICPLCMAKTLMITVFSGTPLNQSNSFVGFCIPCNQGSHLRHIPGFIERMCFVSYLRKTKDLYLDRWHEVDGQVFDWGCGLKPAKRQVLITSQLFYPLTLPVVIDMLSVTKTDQGIR